MMLRLIPAKKKVEDGNYERRILWTPLVTTLAVLLLILIRSVPDGFVTSVAELLVKTGQLVQSVSKAKNIPPVVSRPFEDIWDEPRSSKELFDHDTKIMWAYWDSGLEGMPELCRYSVQSWKVHNPNWRVIILDDHNYKEYVSVSDLPTTFFSLKVQHRSDLLRLAVLLRYGGIYMDASTLVFKSFDGIWDQVEEDKLMLTSLNKLSRSRHDLFNNGLLMTKGIYNKVLKLWQQRMLKYTESPSLTMDEMRTDPTFARVVEHWDDPSLGVLAEMVPYHSNLWMLDDIIWNNDESVADHVLSLPKFRWGFWFQSLPHLIAESRKQRGMQSGVESYVIDPATDPEYVGWGALAVARQSFSFFPLALNEDIDLATRLLHNTHILKFTSHDLDLIEMGFRRWGFDNTLGYLYRAAGNTTLFPLQEATLDGAVAPKVLQQASIQ